MTLQGQQLAQAERQRAAQERAARTASEAALSGATTGSTSDDYYYYNNNIKHASGRVVKNSEQDFWNPEEGERIVQAYIDNVCDDGMTAAVARMIEGAYHAGLTVEEIIMAIEETGLAPRPSPRYLRAILVDWMANGRTVARCRFYSESNNSRLAWWRCKR